MSCIKIEETSQRPPGRRELAKPHIHSYFRKLGYSTLRDLVFQTLRPSEDLHPAASGYFLSAFVQSADQLALRKILSSSETICPTTVDQAPQPHHQGRRPVDRSQTSAGHRVPDRQNRYLEEPAVGLNSFSRICGAMVRVIPVCVIYPIFHGYEVEGPGTCHVFFNWCWLTEEWTCKPGA